MILHNLPIPYQARWEHEGAVTEDMAISSVTAAESRDQLSVISPRMLSFRDWRGMGD
jgi:hypothetical protein